MPADTHAYGRQILGNPPTNVAAITPSDSVDLAYATTCVYCQSSGILYVDGLESGINVPVPMATGCNPGRFSRIYATGRTVPGTIVVGW